MFNFNMPSVVMIISGAISLFFIVFVIRQKNDKCAFFLKLMMASAAIWAISNGFELALNDIWLKVFLSKLTYVGVCSIVPLWVLFILNYVKHPLLLKKGLYRAIFVIPTIMLGFVFTNELHGLVWPSIEPMAIDGGIRIIYGHGIAVLLFAIYSAIIVLSGIFLLLGSLNTTSILIRRQMVMVIAASVTPWIFNAVYLLGFSPRKGVDLTPMGFIITGLMFNFGVLRFKMLDIMPVARYILFREVSDGVIVIDDKNRIVDINPSTTEILGMEAEKILGNQVEDVMPAFSELMEKTGNDDRIRNCCIRMNGKYIDVRISRLMDKNKGYGFLAVFRDISNIRRVQEELMRAKEEAEAANNAKSRFLANVSHEIRTPMNGVMGFLELLSHTGLDRVQAEYLSDAKSAANTLLCLLNDILDYSKGEAGMLQLEHIPVDLRMLVSETASLFEPAASKNGTRLEYHISEDIPPCILGDPVRLRQVLNNLAGNAVKFTMNGVVTINVYTQKEDENSDILKIEVKDTGIGMDDQTLERIFQAFAQADTSTTRKYGGTGLGLSITNKIIDLHGGKIEVESEPGKGSCFIVSIGLEPAGPVMKYTDTEQSAAATAADHGHAPGVMGIKSTSKGSILLVDDIEANRKLASILLKKQGYEVDCADNGKIAIEMCDIKTYDLVLMDCQMPDMDGYQATREIRAGQGKSKSAPIIAMTANDSESDREECRAAGMDDYIPKPIRVEVMNKVLSKYLDR